MKPTRARRDSGRVGNPTASELQVAVVLPADRARFDQLLTQKHYLEAAAPIGDFLRQVVIRDGQWVALVGGDRRR